MRSSSASTPVAPAPRQPTWLSARLFALAVAGNLAPLLWFETLPTRDGPAHLYGAMLIRELLFDPDAGLARFVAWNAAPVPNWAGHALMAAAMAVVDPVDAERLVIAAIAVLLPVSLRFAIRAVTSRFTGLEFLALPMAWGVHLHWGFFNFCLSLSAYLLALGYFLRRAERPGGRSIVTFGVLAAATYFASLLALCHLTMSVVVWLTVSTGRRARRLIPLWLLGLAPAFVLWAVFIAWQPAIAPSELAFPSWTWAAAQLVRLDILRWGADDRAVTAAIALGFWTLAAAALVRRSTSRTIPANAGLLAVAAAATLVLFLAPTSVGGGSMLTPRHACFAMFAIVLYLAAVPDALPRPGLLVAAAMLSAAALHASRWSFVADYAAAIATLRQTAVLPAGTVLHAAPASGGQPGHDGASGAIELGESAAAYVAIDQRAVWVNFYEARTSHFPLILRDEWRGPARRPITAALIWLAPDAATKVALAREVLADAGGIGCARDLPVAGAPTLFLADCAPAERVTAPAALASGAGAEGSR